MSEIAGFMLYEDSLMNQDEGLAHAAAFLKDSIIAEPRPGEMRWF